MKKLFALILFSLIVGCSDPGTILGTTYTEDLVIQEVSLGDGGHIYVARYKDVSKDSSKITSTAKPLSKTTIYTITVDERGNVVKTVPIMEGK